MIFHITIKIFSIVPLQIFRKKKSWKARKVFPYRQLNRSSARQVQVSSMLEAAPSAKLTSIYTSQDSWPRNKTMQPQHHPDSTEVDLRVALTAALSFTVVTLRRPRLVTALQLPLSRQVIGKAWMLPCLITINRTTSSPSDASKACAWWLRVSLSKKRVLATKLL